ncbi:MAG TPA: Mut7-C RNAse domain-containing protein [Vicinamibacterales bacterium]
MHATLRFYAELNDFLPRERRQIAFEHSWDGQVAVKDLVEGLGVPHTEVDLLLVNGESCGFERLLHDGDRVAVYPVFEALDIAAVTRVRPEPLREPAFVLDAHLGRLAALLRFAGFDSLYRNDFDDRELAEISAVERRILLTRDRELLKRAAVTHGFYVRKADPIGQFADVIERFDLRRLARPFTRCSRCNRLLEPATAASVAERVPPRSRDAYRRFLRCPGCGRLYWEGSHHRRLAQRLATVLVPQSG